MKEGLYKHKTSLDYQMDTEYNVESMGSSRSLGKRVIV